MSKQCIKLIEFIVFCYRKQVGSQDKVSFLVVQVLLLWLSPRSVVVCMIEGVCPIMISETYNNPD